MSVRDATSQSDSSVGHCSFGLVHRTHAAAASIVVESALVCEASVTKSHPGGSQALLREPGTARLRAHRVRDTRGWPRGGEPRGGCGVLRSQMRRATCDPRKRPWLPPRVSDGNYQAGMRNKHPDAS